MKSTLPQGEPSLVVVFGATGDLTRRKLIPALYNLACVGCTHREFEVLGIGRTKLSDDDFRSRLRDAAAKSRDARHFNEEDWQAFAKRLHYLVGDANQAGFYPQLEAKLEEMQKNGASKTFCFTSRLRPLSRHPSWKVWVRQGWQRTALAGLASSWKSPSDVISRVHRI